jgi:parvulin-like peptidyl-prolyl isomerase
MNRFPKAAALLLVLATAAAAAAPAAAPIVIEDTVALVNGKAILLSEYQKEAAASLADWRRTNPAAPADAAVERRIREGALEMLITRELLVQIGTRAKMSVDERDIDDAVEEIKGRFREDDETGRARGDVEVEKLFANKLKADGVDYAQFRKSLTRDILARKVIEENVTAKLSPPGEAETRAYFDKILGFMASGSTAAPAGMDADDAAVLREAARQIREAGSEAVRVQRILIRLAPGAPDSERRRALKTAQDVKKRIDDGADFGRVAREASEDPETAPLGGDIGWVVRGAAPKELEDATFSMPVGPASEPIATEVGYNVIRVSEKRAAQPPDYDRFMGDLGKILSGIAQRKKLAAYLKALRAKAVIERRLPAAL